MRTRQERMETRGWLAPEWADARKDGWRGFGDAENRECQENR